MTTANITATNTPRVTVIDPRAPEKAKLRVAAYARVSSDSEDQVNSYIAQVDFYSKHIAGKEEWEMVDIYADEGISGLEARNRDEFNRMMVDCREGKIDRVLCKSISRFARNTQEYIQFVRELLRLGISIHFEKENIDTGKMTSEQIAQIYGAFAQMESTSHSSNMRFSVRVRMENGLFIPPSVPYGYRLTGRDLEIVPEEAAVVCRIFSAYLSGQGKDDIAKELNQLGVDRGRNREKWYPSTVAYILTNISYTGNMIWQKSYATDTIPFQQVRNRGQKPRYFVEHSHPAIVSSEDFQRVQKLMSFRNEQFRGTVRQRRETLYSKVMERRQAREQTKAICPNCGKEFQAEWGTGKQRRFCSDPCRIEWWAAYHKANPSTEEPAETCAA
ncbi:recombinase family protein, partial [Pseudoflavonifractor phocaeensis]|uniref:recombinase family protein n=1 Tax=Pseudoflavonifractor phocaeensis TaxID=1870988 RepID=UPI001FAF2FEA